MYGVRYVYVCNFTKCMGVHHSKMKTHHCTHERIDGSRIGSWLVDSVVSPSYQPLEYGTCTLRIPLEKTEISGHDRHWTQCHEHVHGGLWSLWPVYIYGACRNISRKLSEMCGPPQSFIWNQNSSNAILEHFHRQKLGDAVLVKKSRQVYFMATRIVNDV